MSAHKDMHAASATPDDGLPTAPPPARLRISAKPPVRDMSARDRGPKHPSGVSPIGLGGDGRDGSVRRYVRQARLAALEDVLSSRDWQILRVLAQHGFLSTHHAQGFCFTDHASGASVARSTRRVLARLERDGLIRSLPRRHGGLLAGSAPATWQLAPAGARLLSQEGARYRTRVPSLHHLRHCLALADVHLQFRDLARTGDEQLDVAVEHAARRSFDGLGGERQWLKPDLAVTLRGRDRHGPYEDRWFVEVDLGTESLPTLVAKCTSYETYRASGREQDRTGSFPLVLWAMGGPRSDARRLQLAAIVGRSAKFTPGLYRFPGVDNIAEAVRGDASARGAS